MLGLNCSYRKNSEAQRVSWTSEKPTLSVLGCSEAFAFDSIVASLRKHLVVYFLASVANVTAQTRFRDRRATVYAPPRLDATLVLSMLLRTG